MRAAPLALCLSLMACTAIPALDETVSPDLSDADFPELIALEPAPEDSTPDAEAQIPPTSAGLEARVAGLNARASALRGSTVVDPNTRERLGTGIN